jgi:hypothetical protein
MLFDFCFWFQFQKTVTLTNFVSFVVNADCQEMILHESDAYRVSRALRITEAPMVNEA